MPKATAPVPGDLPVPGELRDTLRWATQSLRDIYGSRLRRLVLFGSQTRGEDRPESDVDLLLSCWRDRSSSCDEAKRTSRVATHPAAYRDTALFFVHESEETFDEGRSPLVQPVLEERIDLLGLSGGSNSSESPYEAIADLSQEDAANLIEDAHWFIGVVEKHRPVVEYDARPTPSSRSEVFHGTYFKTRSRGQVLIRSVSVQLLKRVHPSSASSEGGRYSCRTAFQKPPPLGHFYLALNQFVVEPTITVEKLA